MSIEFAMAARDIALTWILSPIEEPLGVPERKTAEGQVPPCPVQAGAYTLRHE